jgi:hypothetical protein
MIAGDIDNSDIDIRFGTGLHGIKDLVQKGLVAQLFQGMGIGNGDQLGDPFVKKKINGTASVFSQGFQVLINFGRIGNTELIIDGKA